MMFPLGTPADFSTGHLRADATGSRGTLLPKAVYQQIPIAGSGPAAVGADGMAPYENLRVVSVRLDPSWRPPPDRDDDDLQEPAASRLSGARRQRLLGHGVRFGGACLLQPHARRIARRGRRDRAAAGGGRHPGGKGAAGDASDHGGARFGGRLREGSQALVLGTPGRPTSSGPRHDCRQRRFQLGVLRFRVSERGHKRPRAIAIAGLPTNTAREIFFRGFSPSTLDGTFTPSPSGPDNFTALAKEGTVATLAAADKAKIAAALVHFTNPAFTTPDSVDCAQRHTADPLEVNIAAKRPASRRRITPTCSSQTSAGCSRRRWHPPTSRSAAWMHPPSSSTPSATRRQFRPSAGGPSTRRPPSSPSSTTVNCASIVPRTAHDAVSAGRGYRHVAAHNVPGAQDCAC